MSAESVSSLPTTRVPPFQKKIHFPSNKVAACMLRLSDFFSQPVYNMIKAYQMIRFTNAFYPEEGTLQKLALKVMYAVALVTWAITLVFSTLPALFFKAIGSYMLDASFIHARGAAPLQKLEKSQRVFTLLTWNVCCIPGHSPASGVFPASDRTRLIADKVIEQNADVVVLSEVFDNLTATAFSEKLASFGYAHFFSHMDKHKNLCGLPSGLFVASKFDVINPQFTPFKTHNQIEKGVFAFDLMSEGSRFAHICTAHLSDSDVPSSPREEEVSLRQQQMETILKELPEEPICTVLAGDLNLDDTEMQNASWKNRFDAGKVTGEKTWGGDRACAATTGARSSGPRNLDHAMLVKNGAAAIRTAVREVGFDGSHLNETALSDHALLFSLIRVNAPQSQTQ
jgi:endonuclease/exonuclease/phosphatase family metal-dependent hydrolase